MLWGLTDVYVYGEVRLLSACTYNQLTFRYTAIVFVIYGTARSLVYYINGRIKAHKDCASIALPRQIADHRMVSTIKALHVCLSS